MESIKLEKVKFLFLELLLSLSGGQELLYLVHQDQKMMFPAFKPTALFVQFWDYSFTKVLFVCDGAQETDLIQ